MVLIELDAEGAEAVQLDGVEGGELIVVDRLGAGIALDARELEALQLAAPVLPVVVELSGHQQAHGPAVVEIEAATELTRDREIRIELVVLTHVPEIEETGTQGTVLGEPDRLKLFTAEALDVVRDAPGAVIVTPEIVTAALVVQAVTAGGFVVTATADAEGEEILIRDGLGAHVDYTATEVAGVLGGVGLLYQQAADDVLRHDVQRHRLLERHRAGNAEPVEQARGVTLPEPADVHVLSAHETQASHPGQRFAHAVVGQDSQVLRIEDVGDLRGVAFLVRDETSQHDDLLDRAGCLYVGPLSSRLLSRGVARRDGAGDAQGEG